MAARSQTIPLQGEPDDAARTGVRPVLPCRWDLSFAEAKRLQDELRSRVLACPLRRRGFTRVAGCDVAIANDRLIAAVLVYRFPELELVDTAVAESRPAFPYVPGYLSFREIPVLLRAFASLKERPQVILCDAQGRAHPRRFGLASHLGVLLDIPTIGCAKSRLIGEHEEPGRERGEWAPLRDGREVIGAVLRARTGVKPLYISIGHRVRLADAIRVVLECGAGYRLPEPTRQADQRVGRLAREARGSAAGAAAGVVP